MRFSFNKYCTLESYRNFASREKRSWGQPLCVKGDNSECSFYWELNQTVKIKQSSKNLCKI